jgi:hypothetical protein
LKLLIFNLAKTLHWSIHIDDPLKQELSFLPGWALINPLVYQDFDNTLKTQHHFSNPYLYAAIGPRVFATTSSLLFITPENFSFRTGDKDSEVVEEYHLFFDIIGQISHFLANLRYLSKQFELASGTSSFLSLSLAEVTVLPDLKFPKISSRSMIQLIKQHLIDSAITWNNIQTAAIAPRNTLPPTFDTILLDGIQAFADGDYRRAILYSAMAIEIIAATKLDEVYEMMIQQQGDATADYLRIISMSQAQGQIAIKDPIYDYLSSRQDFAQLLHERPLYLLKKSLLIENEQLYQTARKLYRTRNKIVHRGEPPTGDDTSYFEMREADALTALECSIQIFRWFGETGEYTIPKFAEYETNEIEES